MSDAKYVVPEKGLKWVIRARYGTANQKQTEAISRDLEAFIAWQSENPPVPTLEQFRKLKADCAMGGEQNLIAVWLRRMYLAPEPEVPDEIKDLLYFSAPGARIGCKDPIEASIFIKESDRRVLEAYRLGLTETLKKEGTK